MNRREQYKDSAYYHASRASDFTGRDYVMYRLFEFLPGVLSWGTIIGCIVFSFLTPVFVSYFIIAFAFYWMLKNAYLSIHLRHNWKRMKHNLKVSWQDMLVTLKYEHVYHMVLLPFYKENQEVVEHSLEALLKTQYDKKKMIIVLASEERAGVHAEHVLHTVLEKYKDSFGYIIGTVHPSNTLGEMPGKGSNISYSAEQARVRVLDAHAIPYEDVLVSAFDIDTVAYPDYFNCLTWHFLTTEDRFKASFQPVPLYNNNIWDAPAISRVVATSSTFWQMIQQERPEKLATFSSHSVSFKTLFENKYWQPNMVSEDSRIFWNLFAAHNGDYRVVPISYPVSMDANLAPSFRETMINIYKQHRRWMWGVENIPYILMFCVKNKAMPLRKKIKVALAQLEGFWSLATAPIIIFMLGWLPLMLGGHEFNSTVLARNLPIVMRNLMNVTLLGLVLLAAISASLMPPRPPQGARHRRLTAILQWVLVPITIMIFGAIPGLDAQTRLLFGKYMGFWVTPKHRK